MDTKANTSESAEAAYTEASHIFVANLSQRAEALFVVGEAVRQPVASGGR